MKIFKLLGAVLLLALVGMAGAFLVSSPEPPPQGSESARRLQPGPYAAESKELVLEDPSRSTPAHGDFEGAASRTLATTVWHPVGAPGPHPLVVFSHGFMGQRVGGDYLAEHLASHGYVIVAADFPSTHRAAPGGADLRGVADQPGDVSFLIDRVVGWGENERPFPGSIDVERIGAMGISLGGLTTTLVAFHPDLRDPRIKAAISLAGPMAIFSRRFFEIGPVPFLYIGGTSDLLIDYGVHARLVPDRVPSGALLTIDGGSHLGFVGFSTGLLRFLSNADSLACRGFSEAEMPERGNKPFAALGGPEIGMLPGSDIPYPCQIDPIPDAVRPGRQQMITTTAVHAFFESQLAQEDGARASHASFLSDRLETDFPETRFEAGITARFRNAE